MVIMENKVAVVAASQVTITMVCMDEEQTMVHSMEHV